MVHLYTDASFFKNEKNKYYLGWCGYFVFEKRVFTLYGYSLNNSIKTSAQAEKMSIINTFKAMDTKLICLEKKLINEVIKQKDFIVINDFNSVSRFLDNTNYWKKLNERFSIKVKFNKRRSNDGLIMTDVIAKKMLRASRSQNDYHNEFGVKIETLYNVGS